MKLFELRWTGGHNGGFQISEGIPLDRFPFTAGDGRRTLEIGKTSIALSKALESFTIARASLQTSKNNNLLELIPEQGTATQQRALVLVDIWTSKQLELTYVPTAQLFARATKDEAQGVCYGRRAFITNWFPRTTALLYIEGKTLNVITRETRTTGILWWQQKTTVDEHWLLSYDGNKLTCLSLEREAARRAEEEAIRIF